jgi:hypothetical protein
MIPAQSTILVMPLERFTIYVASLHCIDPPRRRKVPRQKEKEKGREKADADKEAMMKDVGHVNAITDHCLRPAASVLLCAVHRALLAPVA